MSKGRQSQIKKAIEVLTYGCLTESLNLQQLDIFEKQSLSIFIRRMWLHFQANPTQLHLIIGNWPIVSIQFGSRNGVILFTQFQSIHQQLLDSLQIRDDYFKNALLQLTNINCHQNFEERCKILCISSQDILSRVDIQTTFEPGTPYIGQPIFQDQYLSEPGTLFNDLLSAFSIEEYQKFDDRFSLAQQPMSPEVSICEPITEQPTRKRRVSRMEVEKTNRKKHKRPTYKKLKKRLLKFGYEKVKKTRVSKIIRKKQDIHKKTAIIQEKPQNSIIVQESIRKKKQKNAKKRRLYMEDIDDLDDTISIANPTKTNIQRRFQIYTIQMIYMPQVQSAINSSEKVNKFQDKLKCYIKCEKQHKIQECMLQLTYQYLSDMTTRPDCAVHLESAHLIYLASIRIQGLSRQSATILLTKIVQYEFIKLVAAITNEFSGGSKEQLQICFSIHKKIRKILTLSPELTEHLPNLQQIFTQLTQQSLCLVNSFFEQPLFKQVYAANIYSETYKKMTPINKQFVVSLRIADAILSENKIYGAGNRKRIMQMLKQLCDGIEQKQEIMRMLNEVHRTYGIKLAFEEFQSMVSFVQPTIQGKTALSPVDLDFVLNLFRGYLNVEFERSKNYKNLLNKMLKQTFLSRAKMRDSKNLQHLYLQVASLLLEYDIFRNEFVYKELMSGVEPKRFIECASQFQQLLLKIIKLNFKNNQHVILAQFDQNRLIGLTSISEQSLKQIQTWIVLLLEILEDNIRHLRILKHRELQQQVSLRLQLIQTIFTQMMPQETIMLEQCVFAHRLAAEMGSILNKQEQEYQQLRMCIIKHMIVHFTRRISEIFLEQGNSSNIILTESDEEQQQLLRLHKHIKRQENLTQQLKQFIKNTYKNSPIINFEAAKTELQYQFLGCLFFLRHLIKRQTFEDIQRNLSMHLDKHLSKTLDRRHNYLYVVQSYNSLFRMLKNFNMKISASEISFRQLMHTVMTCWIFNSVMLEEYALETPKITLAMYFIDEKWEKLAFDTIKEVCRLLLTIDDNRIYVNMLQVFVFLLQSSSNKSIEVANQLFKIQDKSSRLFQLTDGQPHNYHLVVEYLHRLLKYPSNIYKIKNNAVNYLTVHCQQFVRYVTNQYVTIEQIVDGQWLNETEFDVLLCQLLKYFRNMPEASEYLIEIVKILQDELQSNDPTVMFYLFLVVCRIRRQFKLAIPDGRHIIRLLPLDYQQRALKLII